METNNNSACHGTDRDTQSACHGNKLFSHASWTQKQEIEYVSLHDSSSCQHQTNYNFNIMHLMYMFMVFYMFLMYTCLPPTLPETNYKETKN